MRGEYLINTLKEKDKKKGVTLVCTFSRKPLVPIFFKALRNMDLPKDMHLLVYDNTQDRTLSEALMDEIAKFTCSVCLKKGCLRFKSIRLYKSNIKGRGSILGEGNERFTLSKLYNIWTMWTKCWRMIYTDTFFQLEDDTLAPPDAFTKLYKTLLKKPKAAFVTAVEVGRATIPWVPVRFGVHKAKFKGNKIIERRTFHPRTRGLKQVDVSGVYCFVARTKPFLTGFDGMNPLSEKIPFFAMDNVFTWNIKQHGYELWCDFDIDCAHISLSTGRIITWTRDQALEMADIWIPEFNNYAMNIEIKKKGQKDFRVKITKPAQTWET